MERLLNDADALSESFNLVEDANGNLVYSFADVVEAIHIVQDEMGIAGATALEAGTTIEGSVNSMKAAWENLVTGFADGNADIEFLIEDLVGTIVGDGTENNLGVIGNVLPAIETALGGIAKLIEGAAPKIIEILPGLVTRIVPSLISAATSMVNSIIAVLPSLLQTLVGSLVDNAPALIEASIGLVQSLIQGIQENYKILVNGAIEIVTQLAKGILSMLPQIVKLGLDLIISLANGIAESLPELIPTIVDVVLQIVDTLTNPDTLANLIDASIAIILALANGLIEALPDLIDAIPVIISNLVVAIIENLPAIIKAGWQLTFAIIEGIISAIPKLDEVAKKFAESFAEYITNPENQQKILEVGPELMNFLTEGFSSVLDSLFSLGEEIVVKIQSGISNAWDGLTSWFNGLWDSLFGNRSIDVKVNASGGGSTHSNANGISYVPYNGYYSVLHEGERVLTAEENKAYNRGATGNTSGVTIIQNIQSVPQTPVELAAATSAYFEQARWAF